MSDGLLPYLPRLLRSWDREAPGSLHRSIEGSVVFVDISGFTKMSERLARHGKVGAEEVTEVIDNTFGQLLPAAYSYGANLLKFGGDALLLLFTDEDHGLRACAAALAMRQELRHTGSFATTAGQVDLRMSVGIHSGLFDFFLVGSSHRELMVAGPAATKAVLMESAATAGQILLSPETASMVPVRNRGRDVGPGVLLRGTLEAGRHEMETATVPDIDMRVFVPTALKEALDEGALEPEHRSAAVSFIHFRGFDALILRDGPERAANALDHVVREVQSTVGMYEITFLGTDIAPDGGKIILVAGVPKATGNEEEQMLLAVRKVLGSDLPLPLSVGVNRGPVFAGEVGPPYRRTYTVMGDTVNLAARLMARAEADQVLSTNEVLKESRTLFETAPMEPFRVKGKAAPVVASLVGHPRGTRVDEMNLDLVGRQEELGLVLAAWKGIEQGSGQLIELVGEPGIGKSRLLEAFLIQIAEAPIYRGECRLYQSATPYFPFRSLLSQALALASGSTEEMVRELRELVAERVPELLPWLPLIAAPLNLAIANTPEVEQLDPQARPSRTAESIRLLLAAVRPGPAILVIEDTHWADEASRDLLTALNAALSEHPWLVIVTSRPGGDSYQTDVGRPSTRINLRPLSNEEAESLILLATESNPLPSQQVKALAERAAGNPLFLVELVRALENGADIDTLPQSVEGLIGARIDKLPTADRGFLRRMAVLGAGFLAAHTEAVMPEMTAAQRNQAIKRLADLLSVNLSGWVQFRHALIRDVAYGSLPFTTRRRLHAQVGNSIHAAAGDQVDDQAELLSFHFFEAQDYPQAWQYSLRAGQKAARVYANTEATRLLTRALHPGPRRSATPEELADTYELLGDVYERLGEFKEAMKAYATARRHVAGQPLRVARLLDKQSFIAERSGGFSQALRWLSQGLKLLGEDQEHSGTRAKLMGSYGAVLLDQGRLRPAIRWTQRAITEGERAEAKAALAQAYLILDIALTEVGETSDVRYSELALALFEELEDLGGQANTLNNMGAEAYWRGRWDEARELFDRSKTARERMGDELGAADGINNVAEIMSDQGHLAQAEAMFRSTLRIRKAFNHRIGLAYAWSNLGRVAYRSGRIDEARELLTQAHAEFTDLGMGYELLETNCRIAECLLMAGEWQAALELSRATLAEADQHGGTTAHTPVLHRLQGWAHLQTGELDQAATQFDLSLTQARLRESKYEIALTLGARAALAQLRGSEFDATEANELKAIRARLGLVLIPSLAPSSAISEL